MPACRAPQLSVVLFAPVLPTVVAWATFCVLPLLWLMPWQAADRDVDPLPCGSAGECTSYCCAKHPVSTCKLSRRVPFLVEGTAPGWHVGYCHMGYCGFNVNFIGSGGGS